ncbi:MAG: type I DNA topoisomerase [bacterium]
MSDRSLVIVESPAKAKTIGKMLGKDFLVKSSVGHIRDLPERELGVDIEHDFKPKYVISPKKTKVVEELRKAAKECTAIYLAPDPDREGEAIAWHLREALKAACKGKPVFRVQYNEITPRAVRAAFEHPGEIDMRRVDAQQARRVLDRIVGYMVSPLLWRQVRRGLSAGRVQSVALRLVCERERLIQAFTSEPYWVMGAVVHKQVAPLDNFSIKLTKIDNAKVEIHAEEAARAVLDDLAGRTLRVADVRTRTVQRRPLPPFITSTLQQAGSSVLGLSPKRTMGLAQRLYEGVDFGQGPVGLITYMRTDSVSIAREAQDSARQFITSQYGDAFYPETPNVYRSRSGAQEAHEAIRPTDVTRTPESLTGHLEPAELRLYDLIWRRFLSSQMTPARIAQRTGVIASAPPPAQQHQYEFTASASEVIFPGFLRVMELDIRKVRENGDDAEDETDEVDRLPPLETGESLDLVDWLSDRKETKPPARYSEASLVKALEANGVGRPSTYAAIIETLDARAYVTREKRQLAPTDLGLQVCDLLVLKLNDLFDVGFTAAMEESLDKVEEGGVEWAVMMGEFYTRFSRWMALAKEPPADMARVNAVLSLLELVNEWAPPTLRGKRTYSDDKFVESIREQIAKNEKAISDRQLDALGRMAVRYREQIPEGETRLVDAGFTAMLEEERNAPPREIALRKFALLQTVEMDERQRKFIDSLAQQEAAGRRLTAPQAAALDRALLRYAAVIPNFEQERQQLGIVAEAASMEPDNESAPLLEVMGKVTTWRDAVKRGKRTFDDKEFFESLSRQFKQRAGLSPRQRAALGKMLFRYKEQIPDFEDTVQRLGLRKNKEKPAENPPETAPAAAPVQG